MRMRITVEFRNASARYPAPSSPIGLYSRLSVVRVYILKFRGTDEKDEDRKHATLFFPKALARYSAPRARISL